MLVFLSLIYQLEYLRELNFLDKCRFNKQVNTGTFERVIPEGTIAQKIIESSYQFLIESGYIPVRVTMNRGKLQLMIERSDNTPITLDDCERVSKRLSFLLDHEEWMDACTEMEVSSPGINRPLTRLSDFHRFAGSKIKIKGQKPINNFGRTIIGKLLQLDSSEKILAVEVDTPKNKSAKRPSKNHKKRPTVLSEAEIEVSSLLGEDVALSGKTLKNNLCSKESSHLEYKDSFYQSSPKNEREARCLVELDNIASIFIEAKQKEDIHDKGASYTQASWLQECERFLSKQSSRPSNESGKISPQENLALEQPF